jgi:sialidase-1
VCKRSADGGASWGPLTVVARNLIDAQEGDQEYVCMNFSPVVDVVRGTGRIVGVFRKSEHSEWDIARGIGRNRAFCVFSDDHGQTWHGERDISDEVHHLRDRGDGLDWRIQIPSQGHALQIQRGPHDGRLFFAGSFTVGAMSVFDSQNYAFWSDDLGLTWQIGGVIPRLGLNEAIAAELDDGAAGGVIFNTRSYTDQRPDGRRAVTVGHFEGKAGIRFEPTVLDEALICPAVQASLLRLSFAGGGGRGRLLFSNPAHPRARVNLTVRLSYDEGLTWPVSKVIDPGPAAYSDLVSLGGGQIGVVYERGNQGGVYLARLSLAWLTDGADRGEDLLAQERRGSA